LRCCDVHYLLQRTGSILQGNQILCWIIIAVAQKLTFDINDAFI
jgi:hypothetical protein